MTEKDDGLRESTRLYSEAEERSRLFLEKMDQLEALINEASDRKQRASLERKRAKIGVEFAAHLDALRRGYLGSHSRSVVTVWRVTKVPSKKHRAEARAWMAQRGINWDGSAPRLRHEVRSALEGSPPFPKGCFGLHIERTVDIKNPHAFTINLLGKPHHVVAPAKATGNVKIKRDEFGQAFFYEDD